MSLDNSYSYRYRQYRIGMIPSNFERLFTNIYHKRLNKKTFDRTIKFYTKYARIAYKNLGFIFKIDNINLDDVKGNKLNSRAIVWFKKVIPAVYSGRVFSILDIQNIAGHKKDNLTNRHIITIFRPFLNQYINDMSIGKDVNINFILSFQKLIFSLIDEPDEPSQYKSDILLNQESLLKLEIKYGSPVLTEVESQPFRGIRYNIYPPNKSSELLKIDPDDIMMIRELLQYQYKDPEPSDIDSVQLHTSPISISDILHQSSLIIPLNLLTREEIKQLTRELDGWKHERKALMNMLLSKFIKKNRWSAILDAHSITFIVPKLVTNLKE